MQVVRLSLAVLLAVAFACGSDEEQASVPAPTPAPPVARPEPKTSPTPDDLPQALVLAMAQFAPREPGAKGMPQPLPASMQFLIRSGGKWQNVGGARIQLGDW